MAKPALNQNLHDYTYLNANGYLDKFREALGYPSLNRALLTKLLQTFNHDYKLVRFIVPDVKGNMALYYKDTLNNILGVDRTGFQVTNPKSNPYLKILKNYLDRWDYADYEESLPKGDYSEGPEVDNPETDMDKVSQQLIDYQNLNEHTIYNKGMGKRIFITESQYNKLIQEGSGEKKYPVEPNKVKIVVKFLDDNFLKAGIPTIGEDGYPKTFPIVVLKGTDGQPVKKMTDSQLYEMLKDKFGKMYSDAERVNKFLKQIIKDWYYGKVSKEGMLTINLY